MRNQRKSRLKLIAICTVVFVLVFTFSVVLYAATPNRLRSIVTLAADKKEVYSSQYGGVVSKGQLSNDYRSAGNAKLSLYYSAGSSWYELETINALPGQIVGTSPWGSANTNYLLKIRVFAPGIYIGHPGRVATGYIYTN